MPVTIVAGAQWGDEGKGRLVDLLASEADIVVRCQGGPNAGHTVVNDRGKFALHSVPSGIFSPSSLCVIGAGCVLDPVQLVAELASLSDAGVDTDRLLISERAHLILPYHRALEQLDEQRREPDERVAPTGRGIGPAYVDKVGRCGIRAAHLRDPAALSNRIHRQVERVNRILSAWDSPPLSASDIANQLAPAAEILAPRVADTVQVLSEALTRERRLLLEGQLGIMRDLDWGAYPFVTSSSPVPAGMLAGAGLPPQSADRIIGVCKAYTTAVGAGPFPTELPGREGDRLRQRGAEYGATTGRPRRCGWLDAVALRWAVRVAGFTELAVTKLDVLSGIPHIPICTGYLDGQAHTETLPLTDALGRVKPVYEEFPGWEDDVSLARSFADLPAAARAYVLEVETRAQVPVTLVSVGPERHSIIRR